jgi:hypothetical protein
MDFLSLCVFLTSIPYDIIYIDGLLNAVDVVVTRNHGTCIRHAGLDYSITLQIRFQPDDTDMDTDVQMSFIMWDILTELTNALDVKKR